MKTIEIHNNRSVTVVTIKGQNLVVKTGNTSVKCPLALLFELLFEEAATSRTRNPGLKRRYKILNFGLQAWRKEQGLGIKLR